MITITRQENFKTGKDKIWSYLTDLENQNWRKNLKYIETTVDGSRYTEFTSDDYATVFNVEVFKPGEEYKVKFENDNLKGTWKGVLEEKNECCNLSVTVEIEAKRSVYKPYLKAYAVKQLRDHIMFLKEALGEDIDSIRKEQSSGNANNIALAIAIGLIVGAIFRKLWVGVVFGVIVLIVLKFLRGK